ncbi:MAG: hypothetical protein CM15mP120_19840 [Pseudomonadota bacterium]|nr:MAG: hypothetical protein CM15mP120_19840 [Pseudomonadota bacterium]
MYLLLPLYWLASIALQSNADITGEFSVLPQNPSLNNFAEIWRNPVWSEALLTP